MQIDEKKIESAMSDLNAAGLALQSAGMMDAKVKAGNFAVAAFKANSALFVAVLELSKEIGSMGIELEKKERRIAELENRQGIRHHG